MIIGNPLKFAVESEIHRAFREPGLRAEGYFILHIQGSVYGVKRPDATCLACAFDRALEQIANRGKHVAPFARFSSGHEIISSLEDAWRGESLVESTTLGIPSAEFKAVAQAGYYYPCLFTRGYDQEFDDGSEILRFDVDGRVRLIAAKMLLVGNRLRPAPGTLRDLWLAADEFYGVLEEWRLSFEAEWSTTEKE